MNATKGDASVFAKTDDIKTGYLRDAPPGSFVQALGSSRSKFLVLPDGNLALALNGEYAWSANEIASNTAVKGIILPNVRFEVELADYHSNHHDPKVGSLLCSGTGWAVIGRRPGDYYETSEIPLIGTVPANAVYETFFPKWRIVHGDGAEKSIIHAVEAIGDTM